MRRRLHPGIAAIATAAALTGCMQATRHSNTMIFGTNTQFGIRAGTSPTNVPEINVGYSRQEAVMMPLVANIDDDGTSQRPCDLTTPITVNGGRGFAVHPCSLVALKGEAQDSYSVLASFGAKFSGDAAGTGSKASGGLAQYFATGMAAQMLALTGGASVVAVGEAARESAERAPPSADTVAALFGDQTVFARGVAMRDAYLDFRKKLIAKITLTDPGQLKTRITKFETDAGFPNSGIAEDCTSIDACEKAVLENDPFRSVYAGKQKAFDDALNAWPVAQQ